MQDIRDLREKLANQEHERWSRWMKYMFSQGRQNLDNSWIMPGKLVDRWHEQAATPYSQLSEKEKDSDRKEADNTLALIESKIDSDAKVIAEAVEIAYRYGQIDGGHHKTWVIDQMARMLLGDKYEAWVDKYKKPDGNELYEEYEWDTGIAP